MTWVLIGIVVLVVLALLWAVVAYNGLIKLRNLVQESWKQIDVELHRRYDLIPNLVETVKGYATHEREVFEEVTRARASAAGATGSPAQQAAAEGPFMAALGKLFAVAEAYPDLKANTNFLELQTQLTQTEDRIAAGRRFYNANVRSFNTKIQTVPTNVVANMFNFKEAEYFEAEEPEVRKAPEVRF
jgi:LemA protein